jgi:hypothetical protein
VEADLKQNDDTLSDFFACHKMAGECANCYGKERQQAAGLGEVVNIIGRGGLHPMDSTKMTAKELSRVVPSFIFYKAKDPAPEDGALPDLNESEVDPEEQRWKDVISKSAKKKAAAKAKTVHEVIEDARRDCSGSRGFWEGVNVENEDRELRGGEKQLGGKISASP